MKISDFCTGLQHIGVPTNDIERTKAFYEQLGFVQRSDEFLEDGIPHIEMTLIT